MRTYNIECKTEFPDIMTIQFKKYSIFQETDSISAQNIPLKNRPPPSLSNPLSSARSSPSSTTNQMEAEWPPTGASRALLMHVPEANVRLNYGG